MARKSISKEVRKIVYEKYGGHCAYCGCELSLSEMQVDHIKSVYKSEYIGEEADDCLDNYMPSCRQCNFYKSTFDLETFRKRITDIMFQRLKEDFNYRLALKYGMIFETEQKPIVFYFEKVNN